MNDCQSLLDDTCDHVSRTHSPSGLDCGITLDGIAMSMSSFLLQEDADLLTTDYVRSFTNVILQEEVKATVPIPP